MIPIVILAACRGSEQTLGEVETRIEPSPYEAPEREEPPDPLSLAEIEAAIPVALDLALRADPRMIFAAQDKMIPIEDENCPYYVYYWFTEYGHYLWKDSCTSSTGGALNGFAEYLHLTDFEYGGGMVQDYGWFLGDALYMSPDGQNYTMAGAVLLNDVRYDGYNYWRADIAGSFLWEGPDYTDTWLQEGRNFYTNVDAFYYDFGAHYLALRGGLGGMPGRINTVNFDDLLWYDEDYGATCWLEPGGLIALRDEAGRWYEVQFHGHSFVGAGVFPPQCDGQGEVFYNGVSMGMVAPDLSPLMEWGAEGPWRH